MKKITYLITLFLTLPFFAQVENIVEFPGYIDNGENIYIYGLNSDGDIEINTLDTEFNILKNTKIECPDESAQFSLITFKDVGSLLYIEANKKGTTDYYLFHFHKETAKVVSYGVQGLYFARESAIYLKKENPDLLIHDHLRIYPHLIYGTDVYILQHKNVKPGLAYSSEYGINTGLLAKFYNYKGETKLLKCQTTVDEDGFVWLKKVWEKDLGIENDFASIEKLGNHLYIWTNTLKYDIKHYLYNLSTKEVKEIDLNSYSVPDLNNNSLRNKIISKSDTSLLFVVRKDKKTDDLGFLSLDTDLKQKHPIVFKNPNVENKKNDKSSSNLKYLDVDGKVYFSKVYYTEGTSQAPNGTTSNSIKYKDNLLGQYTNGELTMHFVPDEKRVIEKNGKTYEIVRNEFLVKNEKIYNLYVSNKLSDLKIKKECSFLFYCFENDDFIESFNMKNTLFADDMIVKKTSNPNSDPNSNFFISLDGKKILWFCLIESSDNTLKYKPKIFKVFIDEI